MLESHKEVRNPSSAPILFRFYFVVHFVFEILLLAPPLWFLGCHLTSSCLFLLRSLNYKLFTKALFYSVLYHR